jgi:hypothetical protein
LTVGLVLLLCPLVALAVLALGVASCLHLSADTRALRKGVTEASGDVWRQKIGLNFGWGTLGAVRTGLAFAPLDAEARAAVQAVRGVEVGIFELQPGAQSPDRAAMLAAADKKLHARGWERLVGVLDGENLVGVYLPAQEISGRRMKCCVLVLDGRQMIVVSAKVDLDPLLQCLRKQQDFSTAMRLLAAR